MEIIRNCAHHGSVQTAIKLGEKAGPVGIIKSAFDKSGSGSLKKEHVGMTWYEKRRGGASGHVISFRSYGDTFYRLELAYEDGRPGNLRLPLTKNYRKIHNAIDHHIEIFGTDGCLFSHGDYSIDNILFDGDDLVWVLDWENFNDRLPREFDIVYCVMEAYYFSYIRKKGFMASDIDAAIDLLKYGLGRLGMPFCRIIEKPAGYVHKLFLDNRPVFGPDVMKYPFINCSYEEIENIDRLFGKRTAR